MNRRVRSLSLAVLCVVALFATPLAAAPLSETPPPVHPHVRVLDPCRGTLLDEAVRLSPTMRQLVTTLDGSDVVVYVRCGFFKDSTLAGRLSFLGAVASLRYVVVELRIYEPMSTQVATLGHELQHAVEVASDESIQDAKTMAAYYRQHGHTIGLGSTLFETDAARAVGLRVHRELVESRARTADGGD